MSNTTRQVPYTPFAAFAARFNSGSYDASTLLEDVQAAIEASVTQQLCALQSEATRLLAREKELLHIVADRDAEISALKSRHALHISQVVSDFQARTVPPEGIRPGLPVGLIECMKEAGAVLCGQAPARLPLADEIHGFALMLEDQVITSDDVLMSRLTDLAARIVENVEIDKAKEQYGPDELSFELDKAAREIRALSADKASAQTTALVTTLVASLRAARLGLRDWEQPQRRYKALESIDAALGRHATESQP